MSTTLELLQSILPGLVTGATTAGATVGGYLKGLFKRIEDLEKRVGTTDLITGVKSGLVATIDSLQTYQKKVEGWEHQTPIWLQNAILSQVQGRGSFASIDTGVIEDRLRRMQDEQLRGFRDQLNSFERAIKALEERIDRCPTVDVTDRMDRATAMQMASLREDLAKANGEMQALKSILTQSLTWK